MSVTASIFLDINLPNATTWFYFSLLLAVALFVKFSRLLSIRNWDILTLFLLMPGLLLLIESEGKYADPVPWSFIWLLAASGYFFIRCLIDLVLVRRPVLAPNLNQAGLVWLACALFVSLIAVAARPPSRSAEPNSNNKSTPLDDAVGRGVTQFLGAHTPASALDESDLSMWVERGLALACHLSIVIGLVLICWLHFEDLHAGMAAATIYLLLPYTYLMTPSAGLGRWDHAWPMAWMIWAVLAYRRPMVAGAFLGVAAGSVFFPVFTVPVWLSFYRRRGGGRFLLAFVLAVVLSVALIYTLIWVNGGLLPRSLRATWDLANWQPWQAPPADMLGFWTKIHWAYRMPVFLACLVFVLMTLFWPAPKNLAHVLALSAAVLISLQFWYADRGGIYVLWYLPFLLLLVFRPNLTACQPSPPPDDFLARLGRATYRLLRRLLRLPEPASAIS